jgi:hypothetical protein
MTLFVQALCALFAYDVICACCRFETIHSMVRRWKVARKNKNAQDAFERVCSAVNYACIWYPKQSLCLQRSFVTTYLLRRHGVDARMVLGAQKIPFQAHAWVEVNGRAVNERSDVQATYSVWDRC